MRFLVTCCCSITISQSEVLFPKDNTLFVVGDKMVKLVHLGVESKALVWRLGKNVVGKWVWNFEQKEKIQFESCQLSARSYIVINDDPNQDWS
jgi:hypothetical protein